MQPVQIHLENYTGHYSPGNTIYGKLRCSFEAETRFRAIKIRFRGKATVSWTETEYHTDSHNRRQSKTVRYSGENAFLRDEIVLKDAASGKDKIPAGLFEYPFSFKLPDVLPSTFNSTYGNIVYKIKALVDRPWRFDYEAEVMFKVLAPVDLNTYPHIKDPCTMTEKKDMYSGLSNAGQLTFAVHMPHRGFVPGQVVKMNVDVKNLSNVSVKEMSYRLTREMNYTVTSPRKKTKTDTQVIYNSVSGGIGANGGHQYILEMLIPKDIEVPNFTNCSLLTATYTFEVIAIPKGFHFNLSAATNVVLGHIPIGAPPTHPYGLREANISAPHPNITYPPASAPTGRYPSAPTGPYPPPPAGAYAPPEPTPPYPTAGCLPRQPPPPYSASPQLPVDSNRMYPVLPPPPYGPPQPAFASQQPMYQPKVPPVVEGVQSKAPSAPPLASEPPVGGAGTGGVDEDDFVLLEKK